MIVPHHRPGRHAGGGVGAAGADTLRDDGQITFRLADDSVTDRLLVIDSREYGAGTEPYLLTS
ncbi:hypothetical protein GA0074695_4094 [Micromonospora viridifaciens]|uniref:Uncharacterized protein n=1 Tax=Micromonospora viridifaciens TaxID=1881 RepID=A0A1C4YCF5_MICVI|nr:hypothetical protein [Micromonospora viridifaciens]SCF18306.1 hypothetical protein GA0074695_4094 [Micromonospora viridifaciens]